MTSPIVVIPARYESSRFPGKPLAQIQGQSLVFRTWNLAKAAVGAERVYVATDDARIMEHVTKFGGNAILTSTKCKNGTERVFELSTKLPTKPNVVINIQGDAVLTPPWVIKGLVEAIENDPKIQIATPAVRLSWEQVQALYRSKELDGSAGTLVTFNLAGNALYFSKSVIPFIRNKNMLSPPIYRHIGNYAYRFEALSEFIHLPQSPLEKAEGLEQLRAIENGIPIRVIVADYKGRTHWSIDTPEDVKLVEQIITREGELVG